MLWSLANMVSSLACFGSCPVPFAAWAGVHYRAHEGFFAAWRERTRGLIVAGHREAVQAAVDTWYPYTVDMFGGDGSPNEEQYCALGIKTAQNSHARQIFMDFVAEDLTDLGLRARSVSGCASPLRGPCAAGAGWGGDRLTRGYSSGMPLTPALSQRKGAGRFAPALAQASGKRSVADQCGVSRRRGGG